MNASNENPATEGEHTPSRSKGKRIVKIILALLAALLVGAQFVPVEMSNPLAMSDIPAPADVKAILKRSCYDCHSNETVWPWYSHIAPMSWLVAHDVEEAREEMNFSTWDRYSKKKRRKKIRECWEEVEEGEMPLWFYLPLHPEARLSDGDRAVLHRWARDAGHKSSESRHEHDSDSDNDHDSD